MFLFAVDTLHSLWREINLTRVPLYMAPRHAYMVVDT